MTYNPKDHVPMDPARRVSQSFQKLSTNQRAALFDKVLDRLPITEKTRWIQTVPHLTSDQERAIGKMSERDRASHADALIARLQPKDQWELYEEIEGMVKANGEQNQDRPGEREPSLTSSPDDREPVLAGAQIDRPRDTA